MPEIDERVIKLREFAAHSDIVNSVSLGPKTGEYVATGGADKQVHLWTLEKPNCLASYSGHTTPVVCVQLSLNEDQICAGAQGGAIKVYDLGSGKVSRTLMGHRSAIRSIEFHPEGTMLLSCSADSIIKLWDTRKRGSILSCKGHSSIINAIKFSCNGTWFASASDDHKVKIWELRKGQIIHEIPDHSAPVTSLVFHPDRLRLCSCTADGVVRFFDLHRFTISSSLSTGRRATVSQLLNYARGSSILVGSEEQLVACGWDAAELGESLNVGWGKVQDMKLAGRKVVAASVKRNHVSLYSVNLDRVKSTTASYGNDPMSCGDGPYIGHIESENLRSSVNIVAATEDDKCKMALDLGDSSAFKPSRMLARTPPTSGRHVLRSQDVTIARNELKACSIGACVGPQTKRTTSEEPLKHVQYRLDPIEENPTAESPSEIQASNSDLTKETDSKKENNEPHTDSKDSECNVRPASPPAPEKDYQPLVATQPEPAPIDLSIKPENPPIKQAKVAPMTRKPIKQVIQSHRSATKKDFEIKIFEPEKPVEIMKSFSEPERPEEIVPLEPILKLTPINFVGTEMETVMTICREHPLVLTALRNRQRSLRELLETWKTKNVKATSEMAIKLNDLTTAKDFISILVLQPSMWTLDLCVILLPTICKLIQSRHEYHVATGCDAVRRIVKNFGPLIRSNVANPVETIGVDLCQEERYQKCLNCHGHLSHIQEVVQSKRNSSAKVSSILHELDEPLATVLG